MAHGWPTVDWRDETLCFELVHEREYFTQKEFYQLFFPTRHSNAAATRSAKQLCTFCPVMEACRADALRTNEKHGVRGGLTAHDRRRLRARMELAAS